MDSDSNRSQTYIKPAEERRRIAEAVFPNWQTFPSLFDLEAKFPPRGQLPSAMVTRVGPSPTGMMHLGGLYMALINEHLAHQTGGLFYLRIEDTDQKRRMEGALDTIIDSIAEYGLDAVEGPYRTIDGQVTERGNYGPYIQTQRKTIYHAVAFQMILAGHLYPSFLTENEIEEIREQQRRRNLSQGIYGHWADPCRHLSADEVEKAIAGGRSFVVRFHARALEGAEVSWDDAIRGTLTLPANTMDNVLIKSNGIPTYHFAHLVDEHYMRTTHVIRAEEWIPSVPLHLALHEAIGWRPPVYAHVAAIYKREAGSKRKLSKRSDPEANVQFYWQAGFPREAVLEYLTNLANPEFEEWRLANPNAPRRAFQISLDKMSVGGPLSDLKKLRNVSRQLISRMNGRELYVQVLKWTKQFEPQLAAAIESDEEYTIKALEVHRLGTDDSKRLITFADVRTHLAPFFDEWLPPTESLAFPTNLSEEDRIRVLKTVESSYDASVEAGAVFPMIQRIAQDLGFAPSTKMYKAAPKEYRGQVGDVAMVLRLALFGSSKSPDLGQLMSVLGPERVLRRIKRVLSSGMSQG